MFKVEAIKPPECCPECEFENCTNTILIKKLEKGDS